MVYPTLVILSGTEWSEGSPYGMSHPCHPEWNGVERRISILTANRDALRPYR